MDFGDGSKKEISVERENALESIQEEVRRYFQQMDALLDCGVHQTGNQKSTGANYMLQRWSMKWTEYVDVTSNEDIKNGDKLRVFPKSTVSPSMR